MNISNMGALRRVTGKTEPIPNGPDGSRQSVEKVNAPLMFNSKPGKTAYLVYNTPEEMALLRSYGLGYSEEGSGPPVGGGARQHIGPRGVPSFNGDGSAGGGSDGGGDPFGGGEDGEDDIGDVGDESDVFGGRGFGGPAGPGDGPGGPGWENSSGRYGLNADGTPITSPMTADEYFRAVYGLHPEADPNAFMFGMQGYYTPQSYADYALASSAIPRGQGLGYRPMLNQSIISNLGLDPSLINAGQRGGQTIAGATGRGMTLQGAIDAAGKRPQFEQFMAEAPEGLASGNVDRYLRNYLTASGAESAMAPNQFGRFGGRGYGEMVGETVAPPSYFMPGGQTPGRYEPDYAGALQRSLTMRPEFEADEGLMSAAEAYRQANPDVAQHEYFGADPYNALHHYLQFGRDEGRNWGGPIPGKILGFADGGMVDIGAMGIEEVPMMPPPPPPPPPVPSGPLQLSASSGAVSGDGNGRSDDIPAVLSDGEYVIPADVVAAMGDGSNRAGADQLDAIVERVRASYASRLAGLPGPRR